MAVNVWFGSYANGWSLDIQDLPVRNEVHTATRLSEVLVCASTSNEGRVALHIREPYITVSNLLCRPIV